MKKAEEILGRIIAGERIYEKEALVLLQQMDTLLLGRVADHVCRRFHPEDAASYVIDRNINYTNICESKCKFCAFYRGKNDTEAYVLDKEDILKKVEETIALNGTQVMLQGGLNPDLNIGYFTDLLTSIKKRYPVHIHSFSPPEIVHIAKVSKLSIKGTLERLCEAGLDSLPGGGAEILVDRVREKVSPNKIRADLWFQVMEEAHAMGVKTTATMMLGSIETIKERIEHLSRLRALQDRTGGFRAFIPWTFQPCNTELGGKAVSSIDYLRTLAVSRIFLDNFQNIQGSWVTQGKEIGQITISFGANDLGSTMIEENVIKATGVSYRMSEDEMIRIIKTTGRKAIKRNTNYETLAVF